MTEKKKPTFGALGNPYGMSVPDEVADFFGAEAPEAEPVVKWNEDREAEAREAAAKEAVARAEAATREAAAKEAAAKEAAAREAAAREAAAKAAAARAAARVSVEQPAAASSSQVGVAAGRAAAEEPKSFAQTIRSHWDSLIDTLGIGGRGKAERAPVAESPGVAAPVSSRPERVDSPASTTRSGGRSAGSGSAGSGSAKSERRSAAPASAERTQPPAEIPADAFGLGIFTSSGASKRQNPLDDLFVAGNVAASDADTLGQDDGIGLGHDEDDVDPEVSDVGEAPRRRRRRGSRGSSAAGDVSREVEEKSPVVDSRRRVPGRSERVLSEASDEATDGEDQIEFEVVDLAGGDLSEFWDESAESVPKLRQRPAAAAPESLPASRRPEAGPGGRVAGVRSGSRPSAEPRELDEPMDAEPPRRASRASSNRPAPPQRGAAELPARDRSGREPVAGAPRVPEEDVVGGGRGRPRRARPVREVEPDVDVDMELDLPLDRPIDRPAARPAAGGRRASGSRRPAPPAPSRVEDDDDGYTVDNSWSPDDPRDEGAPKRRPVPAWRRVVDHIVDRNLSNRRGSDGGRRRGTGAGGGRGSHSSVAAQPRVRRDQVPTYLDAPSDPMDVDPFDVPESQSRGRTPRRVRGVDEGRGYADRDRGPEPGPSGGGRRPSERDDLPDDRPRGRRRY